MAMQDKRVAQVRPNALDDAPQLKVDVDQDKARALGLDLAQVNAHDRDRLGRRAMSTTSSIAAASSASISRPMRRIA